jgi:hypothetical protein
MRDYYGQMNDASFQKWVVEKLNPSLHAVSNCPWPCTRYHRPQTDKSPLAYTVGADMISWLQEKDVNSNGDIRGKWKAELKKLKPKITRKGGVMASHSLWLKSARHILNTNKRMYAWM